MQRKQKKKLSENGLKAGATVANIREEENTNQKTPRSFTVSMMLLENDSTETKP